MLILVLWAAAVAAGCVLHPLYRSRPEGRLAYAFATRGSVWLGFVAGSLIIGGMISGVQTEDSPANAFAMVGALVSWPFMCACACIFALPFLYLGRLVCAMLSEGGEEAADGRPRATARPASQEPPARPVRERAPPRRPWSLIAVLIVLAGLAIIIGLAVPRHQDSIAGRRSQGHPNRGKLGAIRHALSVYQGDQGGAHPASPETLLVDGKYLAVIPTLEGLPHAPSNTVTLYRSRTPGDTGGWGYVSDPSDADRGRIFIDCTHTDSKGKAWASY
ncbi:MAG: type II secretion system protein [Elusimicrobia bacterium]|nr:type II secretion system protein [Elusimicrobiota bacterium]